MSGERVKLYTARGRGQRKRGGEDESETPLVFFFYLREFFSPAILSERLEQAKNATKHKLV